MMLKSPYPWFGGKAAVAREVWSRFGDVRNYIEPFFGGGAVLLSRPETHDGKIETVNDINAWLCNFWRSVKADPDAVGYYASDPVSELDLHARGDWLFYRRDWADFVEAVRGDPEYYDAKSAGWWVWGQCAWIGTGWAREEKHADKGMIHGLPHLGDAGRGVNRKLPHLGDAGRGDVVTDTARKVAITEYMRQLAERFAHVRVCCGDWKRMCGSDATTTHHGMTGVFLDPPYAVEDRANCYGDDDDFGIAHDVRVWAIENGDRLRIALCGYDEHDMPETWQQFAWKARGGYARQGSRSEVNCNRETIWFSPLCIDATTTQEELF